MSHAIGGLAAVVVLVLVNGFFVAAEFALVTVRRTRVEQLVAEHRPGAQSVSDAIHHLDSYIAASQLGITMASLGLGWIGEPALAGVLEPVLGRLGGHAAAIVTFVIITALLVIAGELTPKAIALQYTERTALITAGPFRLFRWLLRPVIWLLNEGGWLASGAVGVRRGVEQRAASIGAEELRLVLRSSVEAGALEREQQYLLERVLRFGTLTVGAVMVPRTEVVSLPASTTLEQARAMIAEHHHSRYPVYRGDLDHVIGVLHARDLVLAHGQGTIEPYVRPTFHIPTQVSIDELLTMMRATRSHFAIAVDEFGGMDGIVTLENVLEEIVGEIQDEFEEPEPTPQQQPGGVTRIDGLDGVDVLRELLGFEPEPGPYNTVAGFVLERLGSMPRVGDTVEAAGYRFRVAEMDALRIAVIEATPLASVPPEPR